MVWGIRLSEEEVAALVADRDRLSAELAVAKAVAAEDKVVIAHQKLVTARMNDVDPRAWMADVLVRIAAHPAHRLDELLSWAWKQSGTPLAEPRAA